MMKLLIAGSRDYGVYIDFKRRVDKILSKTDKSQILLIEGGARGVDRMGRQYAIDNNIPYETYEAEWERYGKRAGILRNRQMAEVATHAIIFWDGKSRGTKNMIDLLKEYNVKHVVIKVKIHGHQETNHRKTTG